jgi:hypothetical protein
MVLIALEGDLLMLLMDFDVHVGLPHTCSSTQGARMLGLLCTPAKLDVSFRRRGVRMVELCCTTNRLLIFQFPSKQGDVSCMRTP